MLYLLLCLGAFADVSLPDGGPTLHYQKSGQGPAVLLLGGLGNRLSIWNDMEPLLAKNFTVYRMDHRGIGGSPEHAGEYTLKTMADDAAGLMARLGVKTYSVVGISLGSFVAQKMALDYPHRLEKVVLIGSTTGGPTHSLPDAEVLGFWQTMATMDRDARILRGLELALHPDYMKNQTAKVKAMIEWRGDYDPPPATVQKQMLIGMMFNHSEAAANIELPTLILHGDADRVVPVKNAHTLHKLIRGSKLEIIAQSGHLSIVDQADKAAQSIRKFLLEGDK